MDDPALVFDRSAVRRNRRRAARPGIGQRFLVDEVSRRLVERLDDVRGHFSRALAFGWAGREIAAALTASGRVDGAFGVDIVAETGPDVACDEERLPFAPESLDLIVSCLHLHWVNDLPGALVQLRQALKPDGMFLAAIWGGATLAELRQVLVEAETGEAGGAHPRVSPAIDVRDAGGLLQRAGFALPVVDSDTIVVRYADALALMGDLRAMGEANAAVGRTRSFTRRGVMLAAAAAYARRFGGDDGRVPATFELVTLTAWAPHARQQRPLRPGSAAQRLAHALDSVERPTGEAAAPRRDTR